MKIWLIQRHLVVVIDSIIHLFDVRVNESLVIYFLFLLHMWEVLGLFISLDLFFRVCWELIVGRKKEDYFRNSNGWSTDWRANSWI
jgi:hypothetical protein